MRAPFQKERSGDDEQTHAAAGAADAADLDAEPPRREVLGRGCAIAAGSREQGENRGKGSMYTSVLVPLDGTEAAALAVPEALALARELGVPLVLLRVVAFGAADGVPMAAKRGAAGMTREQEALRSQAEGYMDSFKESLRTWGVKVETIAAAGDPVSVILETARTLGRTLIVVSIHGKGSDLDATLGSVAEDILRRSEAPVVFVRPDNRDGEETAALA